MLSANTFSRVAGFTVALALVVVVLGAYVRLSHAGLSCPDWPGCYGQLVVPAGDKDVASANLAYPERPLDAERAWKEMVHRYLAGLLGLCILFMAFAAYSRRRVPGQQHLVAAAHLRDDRVVGVQSVGDADDRPLTEVPEVLDLRIALR